MMIGEGLTLIDEVEGWSQTLGDYIERTWAGSESQVKGLRSELRGVALDYFTRQRNGLWNAVAKFGRNPDETEVEVPEKTIRILPSRMQKSIFEPRFFPLIGQDERRAIKEAIDTNDKNFEVNDLSAEGIKLFYLAKHNMDTVLVTGFTLYHTETASAGHRFGFNFESVERIITTSQLLSETGLGASQYPLPFFEYDGPEDIPGLDFVYGWYKSAPELSISYRSKVSFSAEYEYGLWPIPPYRVY